MKFHNHWLLIRFLLCVISIQVNVAMLVAHADNALQIYFLDVGQGDSSILICDDEVMMIDGGDPSQSQFIYSFLRNTLALDHIDVMIATHPHADHVGGLSAALNACSVDVLYTPVIDCDSDTWQSVLKYAEEQGTPIIIPEPNDEFKLGKSDVKILGPLWHHNDLNNMSLIIKVTYGCTSILFMGDAEYEAEQDLLDESIDVSATILRVGHHGSNTSTNTQFLSRVSPTYGIISVGGGNSYGHPSQETLLHLREAGVIVMRTDLLSTIECICDDDGVFFSFQHPS